MLRVREIITRTISLFSKLHSTDDSSLLDPHPRGRFNARNAKGIEGTRVQRVDDKDSTRYSQIQGRGWRFLLVTGYTKAWRNATQTNIANKLPIQFSYAENTAAVRRYEPASTFHQLLFPFPISLSSFLCFWRAVLLWYIYIFFFLPVVNSR